MESLIKEWLEYNEDSGSFVWKKSPSNNVKENSVAGCNDGYGYISIRLRNKLHAAHRLAWILFNGPIPNGMEIDHINGCRSDNRIANLRLVNRSENNQNQRKAKSNNKNGYLGVSLHKKSGLYMSRIKINGVCKYLGYFKTPVAAHAAYIEEKRQIHPANMI